MPALRTVSLLSAALLLSCGPKPATTAPTAAASSDAGAAAPATEAEIDPERLFGVVDHLAADALGGRYTLAPDIRTSAEWLAAQLKAAGVAPVGSSYTHDFSLVTGAKPTEPPRLSVSKGEKSTEIAPDAFAPSPSSASGEVEGEVVFEIGRAHV